MDKRTGVSIYTPEGTHTHTSRAAARWASKIVNTHTQKNVCAYVCVFVYLLMRIHCHIRHKEIIFAKRSRSPPDREGVRERERERVEARRTGGSAELNCLLRCLTLAAPLPCLAVPCPATPWDRPSSAAATGPDVSFVALIEIIAKMQMEWTTVDTGY